MDRTRTVAKTGRNRNRRNIRPGPACEIRRYYTERPGTDRGIRVLGHRSAPPSAVKLALETRSQPSSAHSSSENTNDKGGYPRVSFRPETHNDKDVTHLSVGQPQQCKADHETTPNITEANMAFTSMGREVTSTRGSNWERRILCGWPMACSRCCASRRR